jgi:hypothetical protein
MVESRRAILHTVSGYLEKILQILFKNMWRSEGCITTNRTFSSSARSSMVESGIWGIFYAVMDAVFRQYAKVAFRGH